MAHTERERDCARIVMLILLINGSVNQCENLIITFSYFIKNLFNELVIKSLPSNECNMGHG